MDGERIVLRGQNALTASLSMTEPRPPGSPGPPGPAPDPRLPDPPRRPEDPQPIEEPDVIPSELPNPIGEPPPDLPKPKGPGRTDPRIGSMSSV
jgi:hypothetical protein